MKKIIDKLEEEIEVCSDCMEELEHYHNDWDSYDKCPKCGKDNFTGDLKSTLVNKIQETRYEN